MSDWTLIDEMAAELFARTTEENLADISRMLGI